MQNEKYVGDSLWQKTYRTESLPRKELPNRGSVEQYYASNTHPPIIAREVFEQAQNLMERRNTAHGQSKTENIFYGKVLCGCCGENLRGKEINGIAYRVCRRHSENRSACPLQPVSEQEIVSAFQRMYYKLKHQSQTILTELMKSLATVRSRQMLWHPDVVALNKQISNLSSQSHMLTVLNQQGAVDPDIFISQSNQLAQQLRKAKRRKEKLLERDGNDALSKTRELTEILEYGPESLDAFDGELFRELVEKIIVESNERIRFRLINGLELPEKIERTVR